MINLILKRFPNVPKKQKKHIIFIIFQVKNFAIRKILQKVKFMFELCILIDFIEFGDKIV
jgi:hypothetical protein